MSTRTENKVAETPKRGKTQSGRFTSLDTDKLRGGYYTSPQIAGWLCEWAIRSPKDRVLEPSCGAGAFLEAAARRLKTIGTTGPKIAGQLIGIEIIEGEAAIASSKLAPLLGQRASDIIKIGDFFEWWQGYDRNDIDAVVGNPPFIRYQSFPEPHRSRAMAIMHEMGLKPNRLTNIWVPFVVAAAARLRPGGRMAFVLPAELLQVTYAGQLRSFLTDRFERIDIVACNELFFDNAEQEVVLLLADGALPISSEANLCRVTMTEAKTVEEVLGQSPEATLVRAQPKTLQHGNEKWLKYFLTEHEIAFMRDLRDSDVVSNLSAHATVDVGVVTGKNEFFVLKHSQVMELGLQGYTSPLVSRSVQLRGARIGKADWEKLSSSGDRVHLLDLAPLKGAELSDALIRYIRSGEKSAFHEGYKCSIRAPWYAVPSVWVPDGFMFRQIYDFPRIVLNQAGATSTDTIHRLKGKTAKPERIIANTYTWLTAASAEIEGRSYGGGVLELEPTEAERLLVPAVLNGALPLAECDRMTRAGRIGEVLEENARIVLMGHMGLSNNDCQILRGIWEKMRDRRLSRRRGTTPPAEISL